MAIKEVKLPDIGEGVTEGELVKWLVKVGDKLTPDQPVAEVLTDKATVEVPTPYAGVVKELKAKPGDAIPIETCILLLDDAGAAGATVAQPAAKPSPTAVVKTERPAAPSMPAGAQASPAPMVAQGGLDVYPPAAQSNVLATPATRRLARELNVDINVLNGTGVAGRVTRDDVMSVRGNQPLNQSNGHATMNPGMGTNGGLLTPRKSIPMAGGVATAAGDRREPLKGIRKKIAEQMQMTKQVVPHFTLMEEIRVDQLVQLRESAKATGEEYGVKVTYLPFVMKALIATIREFPMFNASIDDQAQEIVYKGQFNIGFAADTPNGLLVPVIKSADQKSILQISKEIADLSAKAKSGKIGLEEMRGATITITNIGSVGGTYATPIINHPEVAILGMYKIVDRAIWETDKFINGKIQNYTITCDHRLIDGAVAARFMRAFAGRLENPSRLLLEMV